MDSTLDIERTEWKKRKPKKDKERGYGKSK